MRTWVKATIGTAALVLVCMVVLAGIGGYFVFRSYQQQSAAEAVALGEIERIRTRFGARPPLIEIVDPRTMDVRINRLESSSRDPVSTLHVVNWTAEEGEIVRFEVPIWLMRFSSLNVLSQLGIAPANFRVTVQDIQRYGPGIIVDYHRPAAMRLLLWVD